MRVYYRRPTYVVFHICLAWWHVCLREQHSVHLIYISGDKSAQMNATVLGPVPSMSAHLPSTLPDLSFRDRMCDADI